jgi:hypothetical protein
MTIAELPADAGLELLVATHPNPTSRLEALDKAMADKLIKFEASGLDNTSVFKRLLAASPAQRKSSLPPRAVSPRKTDEAATPGEVTPDPAVAPSTPAPAPAEPPAFNSPG